ncbi:MAG: hypothetical protein HOQ28_16615 [Thermoleophilia bacterium]|nr:hypothetical protein [Thermoleophilia bacterium]
MTRIAALLVVAFALPACGADKPSAYARENAALLARVPVYPGATAPKTTAGTSSNTEFGARDWTLPANASPDAVIDWYIGKLQAHGWKVGGKSFDTIRATRGNASLSVGVRKRTLEVVANSRGA